MPLPVRRPASLIRRVLGRERWLRIGCGGRISPALAMLRVSPAGVTLCADKAALDCLVVGAAVDVHLPGGEADHSRLARLLADRPGILVRADSRELGVRFSGPLPLLLRDLADFLD